MYLCEWSKKKLNLTKLIRQTQVRYEHYTKK